MADKKIYDYVVVLRNNNKALIEKTGWLLSILSFFPIGISIYQSPTSFLSYLFLFIVASILISFIYEKHKKKKIRFSTLLIGIGIGLISTTGNFLLGFLYMLAGISEKYLATNIEIGFSESEIVKKVLNSKKYKWSEFNNILIKDDLLTMDFKNNSVFQAYTDDEENDEYDVEGEEFNNYCKKRLE